MIYQIIDLPSNMIGFKASWEVTRKDFEEVVIPCVQKHVEKKGHINYMLVLTSSIHNFSFCSWLKDVLLSLKQISKWNRAAIVSDSKVVKFLIDLFGVFVHDELKIYSHDEMPRAIDWLAESDKKLVC
jgi:hypothetical protein